MKIKYSSYHAVKTSLAGKLVNKDFKNVIESWVADVSKAANRGSLLLNRILLYCLQNNLDLPDLDNQAFYVHLFNICQSKNTSNDLLNKIYNDCLSDLPVQKKPKHIIRAYYHLAIKYRTNFYNMLTFSFFKRQKSHIYTWCKTNNIPKEHGRTIIYKINNWVLRDSAALSEFELEFIRKEREILNQPDYLSNLWLTENYKTILKYYYHILPTQQRKFTLAPICKIKRHCITIDHTALEHILNKRRPVKKKPAKENREREEEIDRKEKDQIWNTVFDFSGIRNKLTFAHNVVTDGVTISFLFGKKKVIKPTEEYVTVINEEKVIGLDPGRSNIAFCTDGKKNYKLTRKMYYKQSGMNKRKKKADKYEKDINYQGFKEASLKTLDENIFKEYIEKYSHVYEHIWEQKLLKKQARDAFRVYCLKNKLVDRFFNRMKGYTIAYGNAKFNSCGHKGEQAVPTSFMYKKCIQHCETILVDEYNTTKMCFGCGKCSQEVKSSVSGKKIRGLRWCTTNSCRRLINRDLNAALNIRSRLIPDIQHKNLSRDVRLISDGSFYYI